MDKYEYRVKTEQMLEYVEQKAYDKAVEIADTIDWRRVKNVSMLSSVSEAYECTGDFQKARDILFLAYDRSPASRKIVYRLGTLALKVGDFAEATDCYEEFVTMAPKDPNQFVLRYKILRAQRAPLEQQIEALTDFKKAEYVEKWAYELAKLYHEAGMTAECLEECDDLILWFSEGKYVYQAMELKMKYKPLTPMQQEKYNHRNDELVKTPVFRKPAPEVAQARREADREARENGEKPSSIVGMQTIKLDDVVKAEPVKKSDLEELTAELPTNLDEEPVEEKPEAPVKKTAIATTVTGATLREALVNGVAVANGAEPPKPQEEADQITGQMRIEEILAEWEEKQKEVAKEIAEKKREAKKREAVQGTAGVQEKKPVSKRQDTESLVPEDIQRLMDEIENGILDEPVSEADKYSKVEEPEEDEAVENMADIVESLQVLDDEDEEEYEESDELEDEEEYEESDDSEDEEEYEESDEFEDEEEYEESDDFEDEEEYEEFDEFDDEEEYEESDDFEDEEEYEESDDFEDEEEYEESDDFEDEEEYEESDDFEEDDDFEDDFFDDDEESEEEYEDFDEFEDDDEFEDEDEIEEDEEPIEIDEEPEMVKRSPGGAVYDTGFVVQGRYDLSATSEIGLKAGLTEDQKKLFSYFVPVRGMSEQIVSVLEADRMCKNRYGTSRTGNLLIIGRPGSGKTVLAVDIVKAIQKNRKVKQGKVAIVTGESLNKKELDTIIEKLHGGALIIEKAGKLNSRTVKELNELLEEQTGELFVVLEEQPRPLERMLTANPDFKKKFTSRLELPVFVNDELVTFGQVYAKENGYKIDEMGILALYGRIDMMQREDHAVSVAEVKEIMDEAIAHSQKATVKHLAKRVFGKNTDGADRIYLKEQDFNLSL